MEIYHFLFLISLFIIMLYLGECQNEQCPELRCGDEGPAIRFPFRLKGMQPHRCGFPGFDVFCTHANDTVLELPISVKLYIKRIDYKSQVIQLYDQDDCLLRQLLELNLSSSHFQYKEEVNTYGYALFNCSSRQVLPEYIDPISCLSGLGYQVYALASNMGDPKLLMIITSCTRIYNDLLIPYDIILRGHDKILPLEWKEPECRHCEAKGRMCGLKNNSTTSEIKCSSKLDNTPGVGASKKIVVAGAILGSFVLLLVVFVVYRFYSNDKVEKEYQARIETFLEDYRNFKPARYMYTDIKRITNQFSEKIGEGAYGTVFKGKLSNEIHVAVKILKYSFKGNGEDFINEVGTIGRIHHVNVVRLVGFCADGYRRALVYEFLPNDSLDKFISSVDAAKNRFLGWEKLQDIALGIAKGIEYLHQGCDQRILHFDIKPHNVLLDQNFNPKISDFGLAKLCSKDQSIVSMTTARGTMGYIAPEVFSRNFGIVSYKADVYSFGMLLLEIVGGSKIFADIVEISTSKNYFPTWIYNLLIEQKEDLQVLIEDYGEAQIVKKLAIVGLWCIQWHPLDRPSMKVVIQMLEGVEDKLIVPPNPFPSTGVAKINAQMPPRRGLD
ncbi:hypothetical protein F2P56_035557 [Juglans regia]|uniref:Rust resistance kinase Lr10-like n=2 Tax=Juglans regia TaxID=51240 RepID=A0A2I4FBL2_JUGRE|nr:rust resistance kinase Lr10-like [Juglans regia]XP_018829052.1 rust resistance kinase Lr10-like [Juglans regia]XP_018829060.1 rust resistance kinase Lr10-like [Juglans regia]KAF5442952.1 hypothetical protein F2P56_035557 [Juglans regia]